MTQPSISVESVGKRYRKGQTGYRTLREDLYSLTGRLFDFGADKKRDADSQHMWALRDVSFEIKPGERVGIIGRNGSGKTTLLRLLAGVTRPTRGQITVRGRLGVLIEIMAGFHPELTGRENIYLNGAIMGMSRKEIKGKFDEIVAFAELEDWIDTPIKRYSSGMHVRLGFAVAAHLDPDILLIDEVLAVGDAAFQKRCLGKMESSAQEGRTVVFVSHNMASVENLCPRVLLLNSGKVMLDDSAQVVLSGYHKTIVDLSRIPLSERTDRIGLGGIRIHDVQIVAPGSGAVETIRSGQTVDFVIEFVAERDFPQLEFSISFKTLAGFSLFYCQTQHGCAPFEIRKGLGRVVCTVDAFPLAEDNYSFNVNAFYAGTVYDWVIDAGTFSVVAGDFFGTGSMTVPGHSPFLVKSSWTLK